jgi:hypothetical protein
MRRTLTLLAVMAVAALAVALPAIAADDGKITRYAQAETLGFYKGKSVAYLDLGPVKPEGQQGRPIWRSRTGRTASATSSTRCRGTATTHRSGR